MSWAVWSVAVLLVTALTFYAHHVSHRSAFTGLKVRTSSGQQFVVGSRIATGGMAEVLSARQLHGDAASKPAAGWVIKILTPPLCFEPIHVERFQREIEIGQTLSHAGIIKVDAAGQLDVSPGSPPLPFLIMPRIEGRPLRHLLRAQKGPMPLGQALRWTDELLSILACAHQASIVHRDVKPENIIVTRDRHLKLIDFGIARNLDLATITGTQAGLGTPVYMSPEHFEARTVTPASDVYSVGALLYEMLAGKGPYRTGTTPDELVQLFEDVMAARVIPLRERNAAVPAEVGELVARMMHPDPSQRFKDAAAARAALASLLPTYR